MARKLIITEKPSVARDITAALGGFRSVEGGEYFDSQDYLCSFAVGHLLTLKEPQEIDSRWRRWQMASFAHPTRSVCL